MNNLSRYRIGILEDDPMIAESLEDILETLGHQVLFSVNNGPDLLKKAEEEEVELLLLDIQVKGELDGVETAARLSGIKEVPYVFTTAFADDATLKRVKQTAPYGYVIKPYGIREIQAAIQVALLKLPKNQSISTTSKEEDHFFVKEEGRWIKVHFDALLYIEARGDYMLLREKEGTHLVYSTLKKILERLPARQFLQVHRSFIVNLDQVNGLEEQGLNIGTQHIPVSKSKEPELMKRLNLL